MKLYVFESSAGAVQLAHPKRPVRTPKDAVAVLHEMLGEEKREFFVAILLNTRHHVKHIQIVSIGSLATSIVHPREVFRYAIERSAAAIVLCHNHPSGETSPSEDDMDITQRLSKCGDLLGIEVLDHIILGTGEPFSFREQGLL